MYGVIIVGPDKRGHHMGDYIPLDELNKFMSSCNDVAAQKAAQEAADRAKIQADNIGHKLLSKMGWKEGVFISHPCILCFFFIFSANALTHFPKPQGVRRGMRQKKKKKITPSLGSCVLECYSICPI